MRNLSVTIPDIGDFDSVEVIEILVGVGDSVALEDPLVTLESDKATMDIPAPSAGIVSEVHIKIGDSVAEGDTVMTLDIQNASGAENGVENGVGESKVEEKSSAPEEKPNVAEAEKPAEKHQNNLAREDNKTEAPETENSGLLPYASPGVRKFARELGADLDKISGTGAKNRIQKQDIKDWVKSALLKPADVAQTPSKGFGIPPIPAVDFSEFGELERVTLSRIKRLSGPHLHRAWLNIPHVTHHDDADITELEEFRQSLKSEAQNKGLRVTILSFVMKALVASLKKFPSVNASLDNNGQELILKKYFNIGIAIDTPDGLVVPVVREVERKSIFDLAQELGEISERARTGKLKANDIKGGCITISSLGGIGGTAFTPVINAPEVAILGISKAKIQPVWDGKEFAPRLILPLDLSYDHRVIDGAEAARFCAYLTRLFGDIRRLTL